MTQAHQHQRHGYGWLTDRRVFLMQAGARLSMEWRIQRVVAGRVMLISPRGIPSHITIEKLLRNVKLGFLALEDRPSRPHHEREDHS